MTLTEKFHWAEIKSESILRRKEERNFVCLFACLLCFSVCEREIELAAGGDYWVRDLVFRLFLPGENL